MTQLRAMDVKQIDGVWTVHITPEAGSVKTGVARIVPLHEGGEPFGARHARFEGFCERVIGATKPPLAGVQFVGAWLAMMKGKTRV